jgi:hypothetical protein
LQGFRYTKPATNDPLESAPIRVNWAALATCHAGAVSPLNPLDYTLWVDTSNLAFINLKMYIGGAWVTILQNIGGGAPAQNGPARYQFTQAAVNTTWNITHNLNSTHPIIAYYTAVGVRIYPDVETVVSANSLTATFLVAQSGTALVVG